MFALIIFTLGVVLQLCFKLSPYIWWSCVIFVIFTGFVRTAKTGLTLPSMSLMIWCCVFLLYKFAAFSWTIDNHSTTTNILHYMCLLAFFFSVLQIMSNVDIQKRLGLFFLYASLCLFGFLLMFLFEYVLKHGYISGKDFKYVMFITKGLNVHMIAFVYGLTSILSLLAISKKSSAKKAVIVSVLSVLLPFLFIYFIGARNVLLLMSVFLISLLVLHFLKRARWAVAIGMVTCVTALLIFVGSGEGLLSKDFTKFTTSRNRLWDKSFRAVQDRPLTGYGYGVADIVLGQNKKFAQVGSDDSLGGGAHNCFINALLEGGWMGLILVVTFFLIVVMDSGNMSVGPARNILIALLIGLWARGFVETSGLFGVGDGVGDYVSWLALAAYYGYYSHQPKFALQPQAEVGDAAASG